MQKPAFFSRSELTQALWAFRRQFLVVGLFSMVANLLMLTPSWYMLQVFDRVLGGGGNQLTLLAISLIGIFFFGVLACSEWARSRVLVRTGAQMDSILSTRVFNASFDAYLAQQTQSPPRAFQDLIQVRQFLTGQGVFAFFDVPWVPLYLLVVFLVHPWLGWLAVFFGVVQTFLAWRAQHVTSAPAEHTAKANTEANLYLHSKLRNAEVIESMGMVGSLRARWRKLHNLYLAREHHSHSTSGRIMAVSKWVRHTQQSLSLGAGAYLVMQNEMSAASMIAGNMLIGRALAPIDQMVAVWKVFAPTRAAFERLEQLLADYPERDPKLSRVRPKPEITVRDVNAMALGRNDPILQGISFTAQPGTVTAVVGPSGSGKTTLARVMLGIWPNMTGEVLIDGLPIQGWNRLELGPYVGYLPQDVELFEGSIAENIARFGEVDSDKVIEAAKTAGLHEMILRFPKGYDMSIGEAGRLLSGGQRQRIGLARAIYDDPDFLVLDEPNANLDDAGEAALVRTIEHLKAQGRTVILITHRPGILAVADHLVVLDKGRLKAAGPKEPVLAHLRALQAQAAQGGAGPAIGNPQPA